MIKRLISIGALLLCLVAAQAEVLTLRGGEVVRGRIVFANEEVVVLQDASGARFQYPRAEITQIAEEGVSNTQVTDTEEVTEEVARTKKATLLVEVAGGGVALPGDSLGGGVDVSLAVGSHHLLGRRIFLGGGIAYQHYSLGGSAYHFLPISLMARVPLIEAKHAPMIGVSVGYGIALSRAYTGGLFAGVNIGYFYQISPETALYVGADCRFQQATIEVTETLTDEYEVAHTFSNTTGRNFVSFGLRIGFFF